MIECNADTCKKEKVCFPGHKEHECPKRKLENQRLLFGFIILITVGIVLYTSVSWG